MESKPEARPETSATVVAGAFDAFANARAAALDLHDSGFVAEGVQITSNPANPDGVPGASLVAELTALPGVFARLLGNLLELRWRVRSRRPAEHVRRGGVLVAVVVGGDGERVLARNILHMHRGLEVEYAGAGVPLY